MSFRATPWEASKHKDAKTLAQLRTEDFQEVDKDGVWDKKQAEQGESDMEITDFTLKNEKVSVLHRDVVLLAYEVAYKGSYKGSNAHHACGQAGVYAITPASPECAG